MILTWKAFKQLEPVKAKKLEKEYWGFENGAACDCCFELAPYITPDQRHTERWVAKDPAFPDPWVWSEALNAWLS